VLTVIEVPMELPLSAEVPEKLEEAYDLLDEAKAIGDSYGVKVQTRLIRARSFGRAIVDEAERRNSEIIVVGADRRNIGGRRALFSDVVDFTLKHAPCRVMVAAAPPHAA
jgi:APA family basic amino acid/polyamine antiporter